MERSALGLIFIPARCHSFCSFNGFRQLDWNSGNAALCGAAQTHWGVCCEPLHTAAQFTADWYLYVFFSVLVGYDLNQTVLPVDRAQKNTFDVAYEWKPSTNTFHRAFFKGSITVMLTFAGGTMASPVLKSKWPLCKQRQVKQSVFMCWYRFLFASLWLWLPHRRSVITRPELLDSEVHITNAVIDMCARVSGNEWEWAHVTDGEGTVTPKSTVVAKLLKY